MMTATPEWPTVANLVTYMKNLAATSGEGWDLGGLLECADLLFPTPVSGSVEAHVERAQQMLSEAKIQMEQWLTTPTPWERQ